MKILYIHNEYARPSGEEHASNELVQLLKEHGHQVMWYKRSSAEIAKSRVGAVKAFFSGIFNPLASFKLSRLLDMHTPDVAIVQNLYPLLSPAIFWPLKKRGIPVVMRCPNYRLFCPSGLCLNNMGQICEKCFGRWRELWCIKNNCEKSFFKSLGYAVRNFSARASHIILNSVNVFIVQSEFQKMKFVNQGIPSDRIRIVPGIAPAISQSILQAEDMIGDFVTFVGRVSAEKGIYEFIEAARLLPDIPFKVAGNLDSKFLKPKDLPSNIDFLGFLNGEDLDELYRESRIIVVPSKWYEGFPNVIVRGMLLKKPIITTNIGAMQSIIDNNINGITVPPGNGVALKDAINKLYYDCDSVLEYGHNGFEKAQRLYSREQIYKSLVTILRQACGSLL